MKTLPRIALITLTAIGFGAAVAAAPDRPNGSPGFAGRSELGGTLVRAAQQLNLTDNQKQAIRDLLKNSRQQASGQSFDITVLGDPGNSNYAAAMENAKTQAAQRVQRASELQQQIYNLLTTEQKQQLPKVLADMKAKMDARRAERQQKQGTT